MGAKPTKRPANSGRLIAFVMLCAVVGAGLAWFLDQSGPLEGWLGRALGKTEEKAVQPAEPEAQPPLPAAQNEPGPGSEPQSPDDELEKRYHALVDTYLSELPRQRAGDKITLRLVDGEKVTGTLEDLKPGRVVVGMQYGTISYPIHRIRRKDVDRLFPERRAHRLALAELHRELATAQTDDTQAAVPHRQKETTPPDADTAPDDTQLAYDPTREPTPESLKPTLKQFAQWLEMQHRRVGGKIADGLFAKKQGPNAVLYVRLNDSFAEQDYDTRFAIAEGMQQVWGLRCLSNHVVRRATDAHIVLLDGGGDIAGGSTPGDATAVWVPAG
jgi:hypothetical protein